MTQEKRNDKAELGRPAAQPDEEGADRSTQVGVAMYERGFPATHGTRRTPRIQSPLVDAKGYPSQDGERDERIAEQIRAFVASDGRLDAADLDIVVDHGEVDIRGQVASDAVERDLVEHIAKVDGVASVNAMIRVR